MRTAVVLMVFSCLLAIGQAKPLTVDDDGPADFNTLVAAVQAAADGDTITLKEGLYRGSGNRAVQVSGKALTIRGQAGASRTIIDCQSQNGAFLLNGAKSALTLEDLTICNAVGVQGGAVQVSGGLATLTRCTFCGNGAAYSGGAVYINSEAKAVISQCTFLQNWTASSGGAIYAYYRSTLSVADSLFEGNSSLSQGGALECYYGSTVTLSGCSFVSNTARSSGGAMYLYEAQCTLVNCSLVANTAGSQGGGISSWWTYPALTHCTLSGNVSGSQGDALYLYYGEKLQLTNCIISGHTNTAIYDYYWSSSGNHASFKNCLFYSNKAGVYWYESDQMTYSSAAAINQIQGSSGNQDGDPGFAFALNPALTSASKAIDKGTQTGLQLPSADAAGSPRVVDGDRNGKAVPDAGAYEFDPDRVLLAASTPVVHLVRELGGPSLLTQVLGIRNLGPATADWTPQAGQPWLSVEPMTGSAGGQPSTIAIRANTEGMIRGLYLTSLTFTSPQVPGGTLTVPVLLLIKGELQVPAGFPSIQTAANAGWDGEVIHVAGGTYTESVTVNRSLALIGHDQPILQGSLSLGADRCTVQGFLIQGAGLYVGSSLNTICQNEITDGMDAVTVAGTQNTLTGNRIANNQGIGLRISGASNILRDNRIEGNAANFDPAGSEQAAYVQDIDSSNTIEGQPMVYLVGAADGTVEGPAGCVVLVNCTSMSILGVDMTRNAKGITLVNCMTTLIRDCVVHDNRDTGLWIEGGQDTTLLDNQISGSTYGIRLVSTTGVAMEANTFVHNRYHFTCEGGDYRHQIDTSNTLDGRSLVYLLDAMNVTVDESSQAGCVYAVHCSGIAVKNLTLSGNGHGVFFYKTRASTVQGVTVQDTGISGIELQDCTQVQVLDCKAYRSEVGVNLQYNQQVKVSRCRIAFNRRGVDARGPVQIDNSVIHNNGPEAGLNFNGSSGTVYNCTVINNAYSPGYTPSKEEGGGIMGYGGSQFTISNCIFWGNTPGQVPRGDWYGFPVVTTCDVQGGAPGSGNKDADPLLTPDGHLRLGSPCIGGGRSVSGQAVADIDLEPGNRSGIALDMGADQYYDFDRDGLPNWFERLLTTDGTSARPSEDPDHDGLTALQEYEVYSSNPAVAAVTYHVDAGQGDDEADGLSEAAAKKTLGAALAQSANSDRIAVHPGTYPEDVVFGGRQVTIRGQDPLDPNTVRSTVILGKVGMTGGEGRGCVLQGLTISGPRDTSYTYSSVPNAVVQCQGSSPTILDCAIIPNEMVATSSFWTGLVCVQADVRVARCRIAEHRSAYAAVFAKDSKLDIENTLIAGNQAYYGGMAVHAEKSTLRMDHCTLAENRFLYLSPDDGKAAVYATQSTVKILNSILWNNTQFEVQAVEGSSATIDYTDVRQGRQGLSGPWTGQGNLCADPCFAQPGRWASEATSFAPWATGDYHLQSQGWRWMETAVGGSCYTRDERTSPVLETGNPGEPLGDEHASADIDPNGLFGRNIRSEMGAYGGTSQASVAPLGWGLLADLNNDGVVNGTDLAVFASHFGSGEPSCPADLDRSGQVNGLDLAVLSQQWLDCTPWLGTVTLVTAQNP